MCETSTRRFIQKCRVKGCRAIHAFDCPTKQEKKYTKVTAGCVDAIHTGHMVGESARWHAQGEKLRKVELKNYRLHENGNTLVSWS